MKRLISAVLFLCCLVTLAGCNTDSNIQAPASFYYCTDQITYNDSHGVIAPEIRESAGYENDMVALLNLYTAGPVSDELRNPFPENLSIESLMQEENTVVIVVSSEYSQLSGLELTLANACLARTVLDYSQSDSVRITCPYALLDGYQSVTITNDSILTMDAPETTPSTTLP